MTCPSATPDPAAPRPRPLRAPAHGARLSVETPHGDHTRHADWLQRHIGADGGCTLVAREAVPPVIPGVRPVPLADAPRPGALPDHAGLAAARLGLGPGEAALFRPDQILVARIPAQDVAAIAAAQRKALAAEQPQVTHACAASPPSRASPTPTASTPC